MLVTSDPYLQGLAFRQAVLASHIPSTQYSALIQDICNEQGNHKPALLDLSARQLFRELPLGGNDGQKALSRDRLLSELRPLYRDEIIAKLVGFIDGVLGFEGDAKTDKSCQAANSAYLDPPSPIITTASISSFYVDSPSRLFLLSFVSSGFYCSLWAYRHWRHYKRIASIAPSALNSRKNDIKIVPFISAFLGDFYILGAARRIKYRLQVLQSPIFNTRPWLTFWLSSPLSWVTNAFSATESFGINILMLSMSVAILAFVCFQPFRLQRLANEAVKLELGSEPLPHKLKLWDWLFVLSGAIYFIFLIIGLLMPPSWLAT